MRPALALIALVALALPARAAARSDDDRPFGRGVILPSVALGGSFARNYGGSLLLGAGASYFVARGFAVGFHLRNISTFYSQTYKDQLGGAFSQVPTNEFSMTPSVMWVFYRSRYFSPYVHAGIGPVFLNKHRPVLGQWSAGPGFLIGTGGPLFIDLGIGFSMMFPKSRCEQAYTYDDATTGTQFYNRYACSLVVGFRGGIVFGFGARREPRQSPPPPTYAPQPTYAPPPAEPPPAYPPPASEPPVAAPVPSDSPPPTPATEPAPAPSEATPEPAPAPPASESLPVPPPA